MPAPPTGAAAGRGGSAAAAAAGAEGGRQPEAIPLRPLVYDIPNWSELHWCLAAGELTKSLAQKGFCFINGFANETSRRGAEREAKALKRNGAMTRTPAEATEALLGSCCSCWTYELAPPDTESPPVGQDHLRSIDKCLDNVAMTLARSEGDGGGLGEITGRTSGVVHLSRMPEDRDAPGLEDPDEALEYVAKASQRKVGLFYFLGGSTTIMAITPREDMTKTFGVMTQSPVVIAYLSESCILQAETKGLGVALEVELILRTSSSSVRCATERLAIPDVLNEWLRVRFGAIADISAASAAAKGGRRAPDDEGGEEGGGALEIPLYYQREAALSIHKSLPIRIASLHHELPSLPILGGRVAPFEASLLGGQDPVTEICKPRKPDRQDLYIQSMASWGGKWDPDLYYDPDPAAAGEFKMYTRHMAVLNRNSESAFDPSAFGIVEMEDMTMDHRSRMLLESATGCLHEGNLDRSDVFEKEVGFFVGLSGESQSWSFMQKEVKINQYAAQNLSNATMVNRLSWHLRCTGPAMCIDTEESSGLVAMEAAVGSLRDPRSTSPFCFASSCQWIANPLDAIVLCAAGLLAPSGRTRVWDESSDGYSLGEGVVTLLLEPHDSSSGTGTGGGRGRRRRKEEGGTGGSDDFRALVTGVGLNFKGASSSLAAPSAHALQDVVARAARDAQKPMYVCDAVEASAAGGLMSDLVELGTLRKLLACSERGAQAVPVRAAKAIYGSLGPASGLVSVARCCVLFERALHGPTLHLRQLLDFSGLPEEDLYQPRFQFLTEAIEAKNQAQLVGVSCFGRTGTNCHGLLWGNRPPDLMQPRPGRPLSWWPGAVEQEEHPPTRGYFIVGTWTAWERPALMEEEEEGVFGYTLTMGDNNWEYFQIWLDEDPARTLHPEFAKAPKDVAVEGPSDVGGKDLAWLVSGRSDAVRLINESQAERLAERREAALGRGEDPPSEEAPRCVVAFEGDFLPEGHEHAAEDVAAMPIVDFNSQSLGRPGDRYRIRLHARGRYKRVEWSKLDESSTLAKEEEFAHKYHIIGDSNYWTFEEMARSPDEEGLHFLEVQLLRKTTNFQIYRDGDWEQGLYPRTTSSDTSAEIQGPDDDGHGQNWQIRGNIGDYFRIEFRRLIVDGEDKRSLRWDFVRTGEVDFEKRAESHRYYFVSSSSGFQDIREMERSADAKRFSIVVVMGDEGVEHFQILLDGNYLAAVHPDVAVAGSLDEHALEGPDDGGSGKYWAIGVHPEDVTPPYSRVRVQLELDGGLPRRVSWERIESPDAHREYLAWGCRSIFDRHCRMLGFVPAGKDEDSQIIRDPVVLSVPSFADPNIQGGVLGSTAPLSSFLEES